MSMIKNRIEKNYKKLLPWSERHQIDAYRLYDRDIPEFPLIVDRYKNFFVVYDKSDSIIDANKNQIEPTLQAVYDIFQIPKHHVILKKRQRQEGSNQYSRLNEQNEFLTVQESQAKILVNLQDYLDTGLFLDHRPLRQMIYKQSSGKKFLNLFCYTGVVSLFAALGGATTTNVDLSKNYLDWALQNFQLNSLNPDQHSFVNESSIKYLEKHKNCHSFDLIFLDPPTFSNSKKMDHDFEVERDQFDLINLTMSCLTSNGTLYFSCNKRKFKLDERIKDIYSVRDITEKTIPIDFHDKKIHQCYEIRNKN